MSSRRFDWINHVPEDLNQWVHEARQPKPRLKSNQRPGSKESFKRYRRRIMSLWNACAGHCHWCGEVTFSIDNPKRWKIEGEPTSGIAPLGATIEHLQPKAHGGKSNRENLRIACYACNTKRGSKHTLRQHCAKLALGKCTAGVHVFDLLMTWCFGANRGTLMKVDQNRCTSAERTCARQPNLKVILR